MLKRFIFLIACLTAVATAHGQELNVGFLFSPQIQASDKSIYETLQTAIREFMNNRTWTSDQFLNQERIECSIVITISERASVDDFQSQYSNSIPPSGLQDILQFTFV